MACLLKFGSLPRRKIPTTNKLWNWNAIRKAVARLSVGLSIRTDPLDR